MGLLTPSKRAVVKEGGTAGSRDNKIIEIKNKIYIQTENERERVIMLPDLCPSKDSAFSSRELLLE